MGFPIFNNSENSALTRTISREDIMDRFKDYQKAISYYRWYPDKLVDLLVKASGDDSDFTLYPYQRILLRGLARHQECFYTFSRGTSKTFINILWNHLKGILYPNTKAGVVAITKEQSGAIVEEKVSELLNLIPALKFELKEGKPKKDKDMFKVIFKNGSFFVNVAARRTSRGLRFTDLTIEEIIEGDPAMIQEVIMPTLAIQRLCANKKYDPNEKIKRQRVYLTTAGIKKTFAYDTLINVLSKSIVAPEEAMILGGSYRIPIISGLQDAEFIRDQKRQGTFNPASFEREYMSRWVSGSESAFFPVPVFEKYRSISEPVFERETNIPKNAGYIFGVDVGRLSDTSEIAVWKYIPQVGTLSTKSLVYIKTLEKMNFEHQAIEIKTLYEKFKPDRVVIDGAGLGVGLVDHLVLPTIDPPTGRVFPPWGVGNDEKGHYLNFKAADMIKDVLWIIKADSKFNTEMYSNYQTQLTTGRLRFLLDDRVARLKMDSSRAKKFKDLTDDEKADYLVPFVLTTILKEQMANLEEEREGINIILKRKNERIKKDKVSASGYALHYIKTEIDDVAIRRKTMSLDMVMQGMGSLKTSGKSRNLKDRVTMRTQKGR